VTQKATVQHATGSVFCSSKELRGTLLEAKVVGGLSDRALCRRVDVLEHIGPDETL
jgi:hypothetical protein